MREMQRSFIVFALGISLVLSAVCGVAANSAGNGVYGGYVGSGRWFSQMRESAAQRTMLQSLGMKGQGRARIPARYLEICGTISFPQGNPFPKGRLPDLRIVAQDRKADPVERAPYLSADGVFYAVLKKGENYDLYWMYYFGDREKFASMRMEPGGPEQRKMTITYTAPQRPNPATGSSPQPRESSRAGVPVGPGVQPAGEGASDEGYRPPQSDGSYQAPQSDGSYPAPQSDGKYQAPHSSSGGYRPPTVGPGYQAPADSH